MDQDNQALTTETGSRGLWTGEFSLTELKNLPARLDDPTFSRLRDLVTRPLPQPAGCDDKTFSQIMRTLNVLPRRRQGDDVSGELFLNAYQRMIGDRPLEALQFMGERILATCKWFPTPAECLAILEGWERSDDALAIRRAAIFHFERESQARMEDMAKALRDGPVDQATIDALPDIWKRIFETRSLLTLHPDGSYTYRPQPTFDAAAPAPDSIRNLSDKIDPNSEEGPDA